MGRIKTLIVVAALLAVTAFGTAGQPAKADNWYYRFEYHCFNMGDTGAWRLAKAWYESGTFVYIEYWSYYMQPYYQYCNGL